MQCIDIWYCIPYIYLSICVVDVADIYIYIHIKTMPVEPPPLENTDHQLHADQEREEVNKNASLSGISLRNTLCCSHQ